MWNSLKYVVKQAFKQVFRNRTMSLASVFSITAMLLILGVFFVSVVNINMAMAVAEQDYDEIQVYLLDETEYSQAESIMSGISGMSQVKEVSYLSKEQALEQWKESWGDSAYLLDSLASNPLPNAVVVAVNQLEDVDIVVASLQTYAGIEDIIYYQDTVEKLSKVSGALETACWIIMAFLVVVSVVVVANTIKLTVLARKDEISIMKYIGATNWFIRGPFLVEGMLIGLISAVISAGACALIYARIAEMIGNDVFLMFSMQLVPVPFLSINLIYIFAAIGISIGAVGSIISMRKFLDT